MKVQENGRNNKKEMCFAGDKTTQKTPFPGRKKGKPIFELYQLLFYMLPWAKEACWADAQGARQAFVTSRTDVFYYVTDTCTSKEHSPGIYTQVKLSQSKKVQEECKQLTQQKSLFSKAVKKSMCLPYGNKRHLFRKSNK